MPRLALRMLALFVFSGPLLAAEPTTAFTYRTGYSSIMKLGRDMHGALPPEHREMISSQPISMETDLTPFVRLLYLADSPRPIRGVWISAGFIDLVNQVAHAKAIDRTEKSFFKHYAETLAQETGAGPLRPLPNRDHPLYWTEEILKEQQGNYNSIVGLVVGIKMAHHYLGHYDKYKGKLQNEPAAAINNLLTAKEWDDAFKLGLRNALRAGCMIEGVIPFFETFDRMNFRPPWVAHFIPDNVKAAKMRREMEAIQKKFLEGEE